MSTNKVASIKEKLRFTEASFYFVKNSGRQSIAIGLPVFSIVRLLRGDEINSNNVLIRRDGPLVVDERVPFMICRNHVDGLGLKILDRVIAELVGHGHRHGAAREVHCLDPGMSDAVTFRG